ncbi:MAG: type II CRISPR-associated endonuclease Cas1 [Acidobacteriota bacterium]|nr:type II CRISPR-associated endonuclease Cas1 [Acidobacteriota bacterium]
MTDRILDFSDQPARLSVRNGLLLLRLGAHGEADHPQPDESCHPERSEGSACSSPVSVSLERTIPLDDIAVLVAAHPQVSFTLAVVAGLARAGAILVACDEKRQPAAMLLPLAAHHLQTERYAAQARLALPARKRLWQQIVRAKIAAQAELLLERTGKDCGLALIAGRVRSGDPNNLEAHAARIYWPALLGESFRRSPEGDGVNPILNYGYAVLRAAVARAICAAGLHPTFGLHHRNRYDAFCLADDLMEPFRPLVDCVATRLAEERGEKLVLDRELKQKLLEPLVGRFTCAGESRTLFDWVARMAFSLAAVVDGSAAKLEIPVLRDA